MTHNPNAQDEMAAERMIEYLHEHEVKPYKLGFLNGCYYKTEQISKAVQTFDYEAVNDSWSINPIGADSVSYMAGAKTQHAKLAPIIEAQAEKIQQLEARIADLADQLSYGG